MEIKIQDNPFLLNTVTEKSYLDLFDKDRLVYLSPQGRQVGPKLFLLFFFVVVVLGGGGCKILVLL